MIYKHQTTYCLSKIKTARIWINLNKNLYCTAFIHNMAEKKKIKTKFNMFSAFLNSTKLQKITTPKKWTPHWTYSINTILHQYGLFQYSVEQIMCYNNQNWTLLELCFVKMNWKKNERQIKNPYIFFDDDDDDYVDFSPKSLMHSKINGYKGWYCDIDSQHVGIKAKNIQSNFSMFEFHILRLV